MHRSPAQRRGPLHMLIFSGDVLGKYLRGSPVVPRLEKGRPPVVSRLDLQQLFHVHYKTVCNTLPVLTTSSLATPKTKKPTYVFLLMHATFITKDLRRFLRECIAQHKSTMLLLHIPITQPVCKKHPPLQRILHNWRAAHASWIPDEPPACACLTIQERPHQNTSASNTWP